MRVLVTASVAAAAALAAPLALAAGPAHGRPTCRPVALHGNVVSVTDRSFSVAAGAATRPVAVERATRFQIGARRGTLADLAGGQAVLVVGRACAAGGRSAATVSARLVVVQAPVVDPKTTTIGNGDEGNLDGDQPAPVGPSAADAAVS